MLLYRCCLQIHLPARNQIGSCNSHLTPDAPVSLMSLPLLLFRIKQCHLLLLPAPSLAFHPVKEVATTFPSVVASIRVKPSRYPRGPCQRRTHYHLGPVPRSAPFSKLPYLAHLPTPLDGCHMQRLSHRRCGCQSTLANPSGPPIKAERHVPLPNSLY
jgi:hypothetical protein